MSCFLHYENIFGIRIDVVYYYRITHSKQTFTKQLFRFVCLCLALYNVIMVIRQPRNGEVRRIFQTVAIFRTNIHLSLFLAGYILIHNPVVVISRMFLLLTTILLSAFNVDDMYQYSTICLFINLGQFSLWRDYVKHSQTHKDHPWEPVFRR